MMTWLAFLIILATVILVVRRFQVHATLILSGFALLTLAWLFSQMDYSQIMGLPESPTGWFFFDLFAILKKSFATRMAGIGLIVMAAGGFARYMSHISASAALINFAVRPLSRIRSPYLLLALAYVVGQLLNIFVPSAAGLAMLLLVAMFPVLVRLGLRPVSVAAVIGTTACLDLGPASGASNVAATVCGLDPAVYFVRHQLPVALVVIPVIAVLHFFWQRYCDSRLPAGNDPSLDPIEGELNPEGPVPNYYAVLPVLPLVLLLVFSPMVVKTIQLDVVTAMLISLFAGIACEVIRLRSLRKALAGIIHFFKGMGDIFAKVVTLIVAAEIFATGVKATGLVQVLLDTVGAMGDSPHLMAVALVLLIGLTALITGSGNAALFSFANMVPGIAKSLETNSIQLMLPTQLAAGLFRSISPVAGVIIAVSSAVNVSPFAIVYRTVVPMLGGVAAMMLANAILN